MKLIAQLRANRAALQAEVDGIIAATETRMEADPSADMSDAELAEVQEKRTKMAAITVRIEEELEAETRRSNAANADQTPPAERSPVVVTESRTYSVEKDKAKTGADFIRDVAGAFFGDYGARDRIMRHMQEERVERGVETRAVGTGAFAGLTVPQYLTDMYAPAVAAMRPFADICRSLPLPADGMTVNISRITTASGVAAQATENTAVQETNMDDTLLTENVLTVAGQQTMSRQSLERSTGAEAVVVDDLFRRYHSALDSKIINDATTGLTNVAQAVTYTDATPTAAELYPKLLNAQANLEGVYLDQQVAREYAVMHSRRWAWLQSQVGSTWPFVSQPGIPTQAGGVNQGQPYGSGIRGVLPNGMGVIVDNNIGTTLGAGTEDEIYIVNADECFLWEDPSAPVYIRAEQPALASLGVLLVVYGYFAYTLRRYTNGQQKVSGTGLIAPTFA